MNHHYRDRRKIDPARGDRLGDGSPNDADRIEIGPTQLAFAEWQAAGLALPDLAAMREFRWRRLTDAIVARGRQAILLAPEIALATQIVERLARRFSRAFDLSSAKKAESTASPSIRTCSTRLSTNLCFCSRMARIVSSGADRISARAFVASATRSATN